MKPQDIVFIAAFLFLLYKRKPKWVAVVGLFCLVASIPFFSLWIFFTGQRLIYYAFFFLLLSCLLFYLKKR